MTKSNSSENIKKMLKYKPTCPICNQIIEDFDDFQIVRYKVGRRIWSSFFHTRCLIEYETGSRSKIG